MPANHNFFHNFLYHIFHHVVYNLFYYVFYHVVYNLLYLVHHHNPRSAARAQAVTDRFESVALQQTALSHILNAEGEKIQKVLSFDQTSIKTVLKVNQSVEAMVNSIARLETLLRMKIGLFQENLEQDSK